MDPHTIKEARRLLHDLVFHGQAQTSSGKIIAPKDEVLVTVLEKIAGKKIEEPDRPVAIEDFTLKGTHHVRESHAETEGGAPVSE